MFTGGDTHLLAEHLAASAVVVYIVYCAAVLLTGGDTHLLAEHLASSAVVVYTRVLYSCIVYKWGYSSPC